MLVFVSCNHDSGQRKMDLKIRKEIAEREISSELLKGYDIFQIYHYNGFTARIHKLDCSFGNMLLYCDNEESKCAIASEEEKNELVTLIERFYIKKTNEIILSQDKSDDIVASNYSSIKVKLKKSESALIVERTQFGSEQFNIVYNPEFIKLFELIQRLTSSCEEKNIK